MILGPAAAAGPVGLAIGTAVIAVSLLAGKIAHLISGCGQVCIKATDIVNQEDQYVKQIGAAYWNTPVRVKSFQTWTLQQLDAVFQQTIQMLAPLGAVGEKSIKERLTRGYPSPWCANNNLAVGVDNVVPANAMNPLGRCGGWYDVTYDPIANDPDVQPDSAALSSELNTQVSALSSLPLPLILGGAGVLAYFLFAGDGK